MSEGAQLEDGKYRASGYTLGGATLKVDLGESFALIVDAASSMGSSHLASTSYDSGIHWTTSRADASGGNALALEAIGDLFGVKARIYGRKIEEGFVDSRNPGGSGRGGDAPGRFLRRHLHLQKQIAVFLVIQAWQFLHVDFEKECPYVFLTFSVVAT